MSLNKKVGLLAGTASAVLAGVAYAGGGPTQNNDTDARIAALEAQIASLKAESSSWLTNDQAQALVQNAMADSESRASLLRDGGMAGFKEGSGFFISNEDGSFDVNIGLLVQFRAVWNNKDSTDQSTFGFENRRTRIILSGHAGDPNLTYKIQGDFAQDGGAFGLEEAWGNYNLGNGWDVGWGQVKDQFMHESMINDTKQLAVERSYIEAILTPGYVQGAWMHYKSGDQWQAWLSFNDGNGIPNGGLVGPAVNTTNTAFSGDGNEWGMTGRAEVALMGNLSQFDEYSSWPGEQTAVLLGGALHWQNSEYGTAGAENEALEWTADISAKFGGFNVDGAVVGVNVNPNDATDSTNQFGFLVQGGVFLNDNIEPFARYEWYDFDDAGGISDELSIVTGGVNYYFKKHNWKWTTDVVYGINGIPSAFSGGGLLADGANEDGQYAIRTQMQIMLP